MKIASSVFLFLFICLWGAMPTTNPKKQQNNNVISGFATGNIELVASYFDRYEIDLNIPNIEDSFDRKNAKKHLADFFKKYPPTSFEVQHEGASKGAKSQYLIGILTTKTNQFRVNIALQNGLIQSIIINPK